MSVQGAENNRMIPHHDIEQACNSLDLPYTFIRPSFFLQNLSTTHLEEIRDDPVVYTPTGKGDIFTPETREILGHPLRDIEKFILENRDLFNGRA